MSGTYCTAEITAEFGRLPPSFLPVGGARLFEHQFALARQLGARPVFTIPTDYELDSYDSRRFEQASVKIVRSPASLTLFEALKLVLEIIDVDIPLIILHGDTLVEGVESGIFDLIATSQTDHHFNWAEVLHTADDVLKLSASYAENRLSRKIACGYFSFSNANLLKKLASEANDFLDCINRYARSIPMTPFVPGKWLDFGHISLMYQAKHDMLVSRVFNDIKSCGLGIVKSSEQIDQILAEIAWYKNIPLSIKAFTPQFLGETEVDGRPACHLDYLYQPTLAELFVFGNLPGYVWRAILRSCLFFLDACHNHRPPRGSIEAHLHYADEFFDEVIVGKSRTRLASFLALRGWATGQKIVLNGQPLPTLPAIVEELIELVPRTTADDIRLWHGDFFFGNIFYDFKTRRVKVIDPRGCIALGRHSIYGDWRYDAAKLAHSIFGGYDLILAGRANCVALGTGEYRYAPPITPISKSVQRDYATLSIMGFQTMALEIKALTALLFISMLPLHNDDQYRQDALLCSGLHIYSQLKPPLSG